MPWVNCHFRVSGDGHALHGTTAVPDTRAKAVNARLSVSAVAQWTELSSFTPCAMSMLPATHSADSRLQWCSRCFCPCKSVTGLDNSEPNRLTELRTGSGHDIRNGSCQSISR